MRVLFLRTKTLICCNKRNHEFIFYTLRKTVKIRRRRLTDSVVMTRKEGYDQLVMSRNSSRIKASRKTQGRLLLSYKNPDFFSGLSELYRIFSKMTEFIGVGGFFLSILFVYMLHRRPHLHGRKQWHMRSKRITPLTDTKGHLFEFSSSQLAYYLWTGVKSSSYRRTRHS